MNQEVESNKTQEVAPDVNELVAEIERLKSTNERLLGESSKYKTRKDELDAYKQQVEAYQKKELEAKGNYQEMLKLEQQKRLELENKLDSYNQKLLKSNIFNAVANYAKDAHDVNDLLAQREFASMIEYNEETNEPVIETVQKFVDTLKEEKKYLFKGSKLPSMADSKASIDRPMPKNVSQMSDTERKQHMRDLLSTIPLTR